MEALLLLLSAKPLLVWLDLLHWGESTGGPDKVEQSKGCVLVIFLPSLLSSLHHQVHGSLVPTHQMPLTCLDKRAWFNLQISYLCLPHTCLGPLLIIGDTRTVPRPVLKENHILMYWVEVGTPLQPQYAHSFLWPKIMTLTPCLLLSLQTLDVNTDIDLAHGWGRFRFLEKGKKGTITGLCMQINGKYA